MLSIETRALALRRFLLRGCILGCALALPGALWADQPTVRVQPPDLHGSRPLEALTKASVVRDYLQSWQSLRHAFAQNQPRQLNEDFIGTALTKLGHTIAEQQKLGIRTRYQVRSHNLQIVFYSPDGLSIQLIDRVDYDEQVMQGGNVLASRPMHARYLVVMTPSQTRWQVRIFQATPE